jgi:hypothetical protein
MKVHSAPAIATWLLKLFCSNAADDSLIGDLLEKYRQGRSRFWYWRQVACIVVLRLGRNVRQFSLSAAAMRVRQSFTLLLVIAAFSAVLLSDIWVVLLVGLLGGIIAAALISLLNNGASNRHPGAPIASERAGSNHPGISIHHIPVEGAVGLLFVFGTVIAFGAGVPAVREIFILTAPLGVLVLGILRYWHKHHAVKIEALNLHEPAVKSTSTDISN